MRKSAAKGESVSLTKEGSGPTAVAIFVGWQGVETFEPYIDFNAAAILVGEGGSVLSDHDFVFWGNVTSSDGSVKHVGIERDRGLDDDEQITVNLLTIPSAVRSIVVGVWIYDADARSLTFADVPDAFIRIVNEADNAEIVRFDLPDSPPDATATIFGELCRDGSDWKFRAIGKAYDSGLAGVARDYGVNVG